MTLYAHKSSKKYGSHVVLIKLRGLSCASFQTLTKFNRVLVICTRQLFIEFSIRLVDMSRVLLFKDLSSPTEIAPYSATLVQFCHHAIHSCARRLPPQHQGVGRGSTVAIPLVICTTLLATTSAGFATSTTNAHFATIVTCLLYTSPSPRDATLSRMPSSA